MKSMKATFKRTNGEELLKFVSDKSPAGVCIMQDGRFCYMNSNFPFAIGYTVDELMDKDPIGLIAPQDREMVRGNTVNMLKGQLFSPYQFRVIHKNGSIVWVTAVVKSIQYHGRRAVVGTYMEITGRKQIEEALRQSEERYRTILEEMEEGYYEVDIAGNFTFVNDAQCRLFGYSKEDIIGMNFRGFTPAEKAKDIFEAYNRMYKTGEPLRNFVSEVIRKDGSHGFAETSAFPIRNDKGEIIGFRGVRRDITERMKMEEALRQSEERYRTVLNEMQDSYFEVDLGGHVTFANDSMCKSLGYSREELIGMSYKRFTPQNDIEPAFRIFNEVYRTGVPNKGFLSRTTCKDGTMRFNETAVSLLRNNKGEIIGFSCVGRDITERMKMEEALRQSEERYRTILEEIEDAYVEVDLGGHFTFVNNSTCRDLGYSGEELIGMNYRSCTVEEDVGSVFRVFNEVYQTGVANKGFAFRVLRKDGSQGFVEMSVSPLRNNNGEIVGFRGVGRDITERKQVEERLRQSEENYKTLFDSSVVGTLVVDAETTKVVMANRAAAKILGFTSAQEAVGANPLDFVFPQDRDRVFEIFTKELFEQDLRRTREVQAMTKTGREIWVSVTGARIMHKSKLAGLISFIDITEQKRQSERLMITDRLASLGELAAGTAHELNNPLTSIIGFSQLLLEKEIPDDIREDLRLINSEAQRAARVIGNLLTFGRKQAPVKQLNQINNIIEDVLQLRAYEHKANSIEVEKRLAPYLPEVMVDYFQMQQVFMNIIINAEYFMTEAHGKGTLTVTTKKQNSSVLIIIADDGPGIPPENLKRIFDPFFTTKEAGKGTGLGLSICHGILTEHGGQIYARSQLGKGATFVVELPVDAAHHVGGHQREGRFGV
jgi:two-component system NtrC family sensor kinase